MFDLRSPCSDCPFLKTGGIRLTRGRVREIARCFTDSQGAVFHCHKTVTHDDNDDDGGTITTGNEQVCAGGLIFADKQGKANQGMRIAMRLRLFNPDALTGRDRVFDSLAAMLRTADR